MAMGGSVLASLGACGSFSHRCSRTVVCTAVHFTTRPLQPAETTCRLAQLRPTDFTAGHVDGVYLHVSVCIFLLTAPGPIFG
mmetsp:Transcript_72565/g.106356  ORF Transcript_72565/g.106356 Transcript_72565/m.106356 type:complete len:82 (+) Transcript_72565:280-525(+)